MDESTRGTGGRAAACVAVLVMMIGCGSTQTRSTRLTTSDFDVTTQEMVASLARSDFLADRRAKSPRMIIVINRVQNLTTDVITLSEQWMFVAKVAHSLPIQEMSRHKNIVFQITPERHALLREAGFDRELTAAPSPTHVMTATFQSARRAARDSDAMTNLRSDLYNMEYSITDLRSRDIAWTDKFEFKREAAGLLID